MYTLKKQVELTHEFIVDDIIAKPNKKAYAENLLSAVFGVPELAMSHGFSKDSLLKRRFIMLQHESPRVYSSIKYFMVLPLLISFFGLSANTTVLAHDKVRDQQASEVEITTQEKDTKNTAVLIDLALPEPSFKKQGIEAFQLWVEHQIVYPDEAKKLGESGTVNAEFVVNRQGKVSDVEISHGVSESLDQEVIRVIKSSPDWAPAMQNGVPIARKLSIPIEFGIK